MKNIAIVTGASSGIGKEFFLSLNDRKDGLDEIWVIARSANKLEELRTQTDVPLRVIPLDLSSASATSELEKLFNKEKLAGFFKFQKFHQYVICGDAVECHWTYAGLGGKLYIDLMYHFGRDKKIIRKDPRFYNWVD